MRRHALVAFLSAQVVFGLAGCGARERAQEGAGRRDEDKGEPCPERPASPAPAFDLGPAAFLGSAFAQAKEPGPFDELEASPGASRSAPHHAILDLGGDVVELDPPFALFGSSRSLPLRRAVERLRELDVDEQVQSILLRVDALGLSTAAAEELRAAVAAMKKPVRCHVESASDLTYLFLTACHTIALAPTGTLSITGPAATPVYLKGLLDKLSIQADFLHIGAYKGAAEPLTRTEPSPEMKETLDAVLGGAYRRLVEAIAQGRRIDEAQARAAIDRGLFTDEQAKQAGLIDEIATFEAFRDRVVQGGAWRKVKLEREPDNEFQALLQKLGAVPRPKIDRPHIALLYAVGEIVDGRGSGPMAARGEVASRPLATALRRAAASDAVKAIVLRVDSPGGSALASEILWHAVREAVAKKPVVVSMGEVAASGGYYISAGATKIFAQPDTLTGSIGVVGGKLVVGEALREIGVSVHEMGRGRRSGLFSIVRRFSPDERKLIEEEMRYVYERFKARVAEGRRLSAAEVERLAQGRLWIGADAKARGLVDELGGLDAALAEARRLAGLSDDAPVNEYPGEPTLFDLLESLGETAAPRPFSGALADLGALAGPEAAAVATAWLDLLFGFREEPIRTVVFLPLLRR